jgi:acyl-CoA dehydrogenase
MTVDYVKHRKTFCEPRVADRCLQLHGSIGLTIELPLEKFWQELPLEKFWHEQRSFMIREGPTEVLRTALAKLILRGTK